MMTNIYPDVLALEKQFVHLTTGSTVQEENAPVKAVKKKKKKVKATTTATGDKPVRKVKKKKAVTVSEPIKKLLCPLEDEPVDPNEPTKIRFRPYNVTDFQPFCLLGKGGYGVVYLCKLIAHNAYFAVKFIEKQQVENDYESVLMEKKMMLYGNTNPFICRLFCAFQTTRHLCFAMEFCSGGDLRFHLDREKRFPIDKVRFYLVEILCAIRFFHRLGFIYRDLKLDNVMIFSNGHIKLVDFGMCLGKVYRKENMPSCFAGTVEYIAPEVIAGKKYNQSVDYWSLGIVAYEMSVGGQPFTGTDEEEICWSISNLNVTFPSFLSRDLQNIISKLLVKNAEERLGMPNSVYGKITEHSFFGGVDWLEAEQGRLCPPYVPMTKSPRDTSHFEEAFTAEKRDLFDISGSTLSDTHFANFEYTNPNLTG